jgi:ankyrin repeat protein
MGALLSATKLNFNNKGACDGSILKDFIENHNPNLSVTDKNGNTVIHRVAANLNIPLDNNVIKNLIINTIQAGISIDAKNTNLETPLLKAIEYNNEKVFFMLVELEADINLSVTKDNLHPMYYVRNKRIWDFYISKRNFSKVELEDIFYHYCNYSSYLTVNNYWELILDYFLTHGLKINHRFKDGNTPILVVAKSKNRFSKIEFIELLISKGADLNDTDNEGNTAAMLFVQHLKCSQGELTPMLEFLKKYQNSVNFKHKNMHNKTICDSLVLNKSVNKSWCDNEGLFTAISKNWHGNIHFPNYKEVFEKFF